MAPSVRTAVLPVARQAVVAAAALATMPEQIVNRNRHVRLGRIPRRVRTQVLPVVHHLTIAAAIVLVRAFRVQTARTHWHALSVGTTLNVRMEVLLVARQAAAAVSVRSDTSALTVRLQTHAQPG